MACFSKYFHSYRIVALQYTQMNADSHNICITSTTMFLLTVETTKEDRTKIILIVSG